MEFESALEQLVSLLNGDTGLRSILEAALSHVSPAKFERNFAKLLKAYAIDLKFYALDELEKGAVRLVYSQRRHLANSIRRKYVPDITDNSQLLQSLNFQSPAKAEKLDKYLQETYSVRKPADPDDGQSSDDSDMGDPDLPQLPTLERVIYFLIGGLPFQKLKEGFVDFLYPLKPLEVTTPYSRNRLRSESTSENEDDYGKRRRGYDLLDGSDEFDTQLHGAQESSPVQQSYPFDALTAPLYSENVENDFPDPLSTWDPQHYLDSKLLPFGEPDTDSLGYEEPVPETLTQYSRRGLQNSTTLSYGNVFRQSHTLVSEDSSNVGMVPAQSMDSFSDLANPRKWHEQLLGSPQGLARLVSRMALKYCNNYYRPRLRSGYRRIEWTCVSITSSIVLMYSSVVGLW